MLCRNLCKLVLIVSSAVQTGAEWRDRGRNGARGHCWMWHRAKGQRERVVPRAKEFETESLLPDPGWTVPVLALGYVPSAFFSLQRWHCGGEGSTQPCFLHLSGSPSRRLEAMVVAFPLCSSPCRLLFCLPCCDSINGHRVHRTWCSAFRRFTNTGGIGITL